MNWQDLIGKTVLGYRGYSRERFGKQIVGLDFILFDDKETFIEFDEQSPYDYHDCCSSARIINLHKDAEHWQYLFSCQENIKETTTNDPF